MADTVSPSQIVPIATISVPHGIRGWIKLYAANPQMLVASDCWFMRESPSCDWQEIVVNQAKLAGRYVLASIQGVNDRDQAQALRGQTIGLHRSQFSALENDEYYWCDLVGLEVLDATNQSLGKVANLQSTPENDLLEVVNAKDRYLIPFKDPYVTKVDLDNGTIYTRWQKDY